MAIQETPRTIDVGWEFGYSSIYLDFSKRFIELWSSGSGVYYGDSKVPFLSMISSYEEHGFDLTCIGLPVKRVNSKVETRRCAPPRKIRIARKSSSLFVLLFTEVAEAFIMCRCGLSAIHDVCMVQLAD